MSFNKRNEKNPSRCRELRQIEQEIERQNQNTTASLRAAMRDVKKKRGERGQLKDKEVDLKLQILAATAASGLSGPLGQVMGGSASKLTIEREVVISRIAALQTDITQLEIQIDFLKSQKDRLARGLRTNSAEIRRLNCVI